MRSRRFVLAKHTGLAALLVVGLALSCRPPAGPSPLPERIGGFVGGPVRSDGAAKHRAYARGDTRVEVTIARLPMTDAEYARWVAMSREGFPQAALDVAPGEANGFYQCADGGERRCSLLVQLRSGVHVEIRGSAGAGRDEVDAIAAGLPLRALGNDAHIFDR
jgi:hypothetical protein